MKVFRSHRKGGLVALFVLSAVVVMSLPGLAAAATIKTEMSGAEVKNSKGGDDDGLASLTVTSIEASKGKLCFKASWTRLSPVTGMYIYEGAQGATGKQVVKLLGATSATSANTCVSGVAASTLDKLEADPAGYFAAITTTEFPSGALRGQLGGGSGGAGSAPSVTSNSVPVSGAAVTKVSAQATIKGNSLTVVLVPGHYPFAQKSVGLKGLVSEPAAATLSLRLKATGPRSGSGTLQVKGPNNANEPDVAVFTVTWSVAAGGNTGTLKLTQKPA